MKNKKGQFYLLAAIIIVALIMGLATGTNQAKRTGIDKTKAYELFVDVNVDTIKMINYNPVNEGGYPDDELENILEKFTGIHSSVKIIYIINKVASEKNYYSYEDGNLRTLNPEERGELATYSFDATSDYFAWIIKEKSNNQYVILRLKA